MPPRPEDQKALTSLRVFRKFIKPVKIVRDGKEVIELDASMVVSKECYELWLSSRKSPPPKPERAFQRALSAHLGALDGRTPFERE